MTECVCRRTERNKKMSECRTCLKTVRVPHVFKNINYSCRQQLHFLYTTLDLEEIYKTLDMGV